MKTYSKNQYLQCNTCPQRHSCGDIYRQIGQTKGPSVIIKVFVAFVIPVLVFISALFISDILLGRVPHKGAEKELLSVLIALAVSIICVWVIKLLTRRYVDEPDSSVNDTNNKHF